MAVCGSGDQEKQGLRIFGRLRILHFSRGPFRRSDPDQSLAEHFIVLVPSGHANLDRGLPLARACRILIVNVSLCCHRSRRA